MKKFNTTGVCIPAKHYMVDISNKLKEIKVLVDDESYFVINRGRQFGKTTTLMQLETFLEAEYTVISLTFEGLGEKSFSSESNFCQSFLDLIHETLEFTNISEMDREAWHDKTVTDFQTLSRHITNMCRNKKTVLMIDEVDKSTNNRVFLDFLSMLRKKFLARVKRGMDSTFHSVVLAGVYDIKNIKLKMINEGSHLPNEPETVLHNSPWNIAVDFEVDLAFNPEEIAIMLVEYEKDYQTGMDTSVVAKELYTYTSGYPFMVSRLCQLIHSKKEAKWDIYGVRLAVTLFVREDNELFKGMSKNLENNQQLSDLLYDVLILSLKRSFSYDNPVMELAFRYGYIKENKRYIICIFNKIFETRMSYYYVAKSILNEPHQKTGALYHQIATDDHFNMVLCLEKFAAFWNKEIFPIKDKALLEIQYRISFLSYLKPLVNGIGHFNYESQTSDERRMDVVVNYGRYEYIIELKRIFSESDRTKGIRQLLGYMESRGVDEGYYLTFDFRKKSKSKAHWLEIDGKRVFEVNV